MLKRRSVMGAKKRKREREEAQTNPVCEVAKEVDQRVLSIASSNKVKAQ